MEVSAELGIRILLMPFHGHFSPWEQNTREEIDRCSLHNTEASERGEGLEEGDQANYWVSIICHQGIVSFPRTKKKMASVFHKNWGNAWLRLQLLLIQWLHWRRETHEEINEFQKVYFFLETSGILGYCSLHSNTEIVLVLQSGNVHEWIQTVVLEWANFEKCPGFHNPKACLWIHVVTYMRAVFF